MNLDQEHENYYLNNPNGNHVGPSRETLRFMEDQKKFNITIDDKLDNIVNTQTSMLEQLKGIHEQTKQTNGRVNKHAEKIEKLDKVVSRWTFSIGGATVLAGLIWGFIQFVYPIYLEHKGTVQVSEETFNQISTIINEQYANNENKK